MNDNALKLSTADRSMWSRVLFLPLDNVFPFSLILRRNAAKVIDTAIASAELPDPVGETVCRVARQTRLWRCEQVDVAGELIAHFTDGLACGESADELVESFGDLKQAAKLIRRAKSRNRPLFWRSVSRTIWTAKWAFAATIVFYAALAARFHLGRPNIARNYMEEMNAKAEAIPQDQRAWPLYRAALVALEGPPNLTESSHEANSYEAEPWSYLGAQSPEDDGWDRAVAYLGRNQEAIALVREASTLPRFGFVFGDPADLVECRFQEKPGMLVAEIDPADKPLVVAFSVSFLQRCRELTILLRADARLAAEQGDGETVVADLTAIMRMSDQHADSPPILYVEFVRMHLFTMALEMLGETLADRPGVFTDAQLQTLAHQVATVGGGGRILPRTEGERAFLHDFWQRMYTDDGAGDGRLNYQGALILQQVYSNLSILKESHNLLAGFGGPAVGVVLANRREMTQMGDRMMDQMDAEGKRPLWEKTESSVSKELKTMGRSPTLRYRYAPLLSWLTNFSGGYLVGEQVTQQRDAALVVIALEIHRRRHGEWPERLEQLTPGLLPVVPPDRFDGQPLRYRVTDGQPVVYSIGADRIDNGGVPSSDPSEVQLTALWISPEAAAALPPDDPRRGDWILWPPQQP